jgi:two-component system nitrogen regulation sensor histidine kinase NtrY
MAYNSYFANVVTRLILLLATFIGLAYLLVNTSRFFTIVFVSALAIIQIISLFYFLNKTNRNLARFLLLLTEEDTSVIAWKDRVELTFQGLHHSFKKVNEEISRIKLENETGSILLQNVIDHIQTGIFVSDEHGLIEQVNEEALRIFDLHRFSQMEELNKVHDGLADVFSKLRYDSGNIIHFMVDGNDQVPVLVRVSSFTLGDKELKLYSLQSIKNELEANEIESWQKLTRVLAHEISNSVTPISTLGSGIHRKLVQAKKDKGGEMQLPASVASDLLQSAELIESRSNALVEFTEHYKSFTRLPEPVPEKVKVSGFFENLGLFFREDMESLKMQIDMQVAEPDLYVWADRGLLEQAFINLFRNSMEAMAGQEKGIITLNAFHQNKRVVMELSDNGPGIPLDIQPQVFIPFFTTKPTGTGIGMSIVRKIVIMSGGSIKFKSEPGNGTMFIIDLPAS